MSPTLRCLPPRSAIGTWRLQPGHAMSLRPARASLLRIYCGRVWVTQGGPYAVRGRESGDQFLSPGDTLRVPAGASLVMEPLTEVGDERPVHFDWISAPRPQPGERFAREVLAPARDLGVATTLAGRALARLARGLIGWGGQIASSRG